jgi:transposase
MKHKSVDYKLSAVNYYLNHEDGYDNTCKIFDCKKSSLKKSSLKKSSLKRWIHKYKTSKNLTRRNRKSISYKITKQQVKTALELLKQNEQLTMNELEIEMKQKYPTFDITPQHLGQVIRDNNKTRKRTRHEHFPKERYKKPIEKQTELNKFYSRVKQFPMNKIICLDETSIGSALKPTYSRCELGRRCVIKTSNQFVFRKFTLLVAIDPGKCDLIYCVDDCNKQANKFRYSQDQRRKETKKKKFSKIQLELKEEKINGKTIIEWETEISKFNRKSLNIQKFKEYIKKKSEINGMLFTFYEKYIFRKLRLQSYRNTKRSEQRMLNNFKRIFGDENDVVVCFGDYEQKKQMKFKEATKGKGMRTLFRKTGFKTYLVDEFRTSCMCSKCEIGICKKTMVRENPKPYRSGNVLIHGLICCKNGCGYWNRDVNGATNIYKIAYNAINNKERPNYLTRLTFGLSRSKNLSTGLDEPVKPKFTRSVKGKPC